MATTSVDRRGSAAFWIVATLATTGACANLDDEVVPDVLRAEVAVDRAAPDELATVHVSLRLTAGSTADHTIEIWNVSLMEPAQDSSDSYLKLAVPCSRRSSVGACSGRGLDLDPGQQMVVDLVNVGTTNADLMPLCHRAVDMTLSIRYLDDPMVGFADVERPRVTIACN